ncbi:uracil-DNA glycosylase family protein [Marinoscillum sp. MHG1-6]|uniref:uracil-DNA glycosylase family protein n=1 Tax=Marinoscillum sp. MHG1-6 TaxID=2959627 RepID=UPI00215783F4|nr:uracil-DNA glycosylase family protein [Marinoscillum sp. MHG1-6]
METLLGEIRACQLCKTHLTPRPILSASSKSKIAIIGQAPGAKVHESGIPWNDASGKLLREWLGVSNDIFYDPEIIALVPMGFCYPGKGKSGDLPPRPECSETWHRQLLQAMPDIKLTILIGQYAQRYYLGNETGENLTATVKQFQQYLPRYLPLPHPTPRNRFWLTKNPWFEHKILPYVRKTVSEAC